MDEKGFFYIYDRKRDLDKIQGGAFGANLIFFGPPVEGLEGKKGFLTKPPHPPPPKKLKKDFLVPGWGGIFLFFPSF